MLKNKKIEVFFQAIISIKDQKIFAFESLLRGFDKNLKLIAPNLLFDEAKRANCVEEFDSYLRKLSLEKFKSYYENDKSLLLFLNFESSVIDKFLEHKKLFEFETIAKNLKINNQNIVLEIKEDTINNLKALKSFCTYYRKKGFIIALDDFGTGYSSFDRLALVKPDIVKIDRSLLHNIHINYINMAILKSIVDISHKIGFITLAEGLEQKEDILICMKNHIDIYQGFYFQRPLKEISLKEKKNIFSKINIIGDSYKNVVKNHINEKRNLLKQMKNLTKNIVNLISKKEILHIKSLKKLLQSHKKIESIYLIDYFLGIQVEDTLTKSNSNKFFKASKDGHDHTFKEYFYITKESSKEEYLSPKYISKASGSMCRTYAKSILMNNYKYIICFDILEDEN